MGRLVVTRVVDLAAGECGDAGGDLLHCRPAQGEPSTTGLCFAWSCPAPVLTLAGGRLAQQMRSMGQPKRIITSLVFVGEPIAPTEVASLLLHTEI